LIPATLDRDLAGAQPIIPATVSIPSGELETETGGSAARVAIVAFRLGRTPVTNGEYARFVQSGRVAAPPWWSEAGFDALLQPVVGVTWDEAAGFCAWLGKVVGGRWRLPTDAEWEFAMSGGLAAPRTPWGEEIPAGEIPAGTLLGPWEVGRGTPNGFGLCDPGTVVHEWCADWFEPEIPRSGPGRRASRGGSWRHRIRWSSPSARSSLPPDYRYSDYGFRVLKEID
jgi:formylglycine-generating enzyme required for sulfatase activity